MPYLNFILEILIQLTCLLILTNAGNKLIKIFFKYVQEKKQDDGNKLGRHIGNLERILMAVGFYSNKWEIVTAVVALKTLARFKQLDNKDFAEYFLIGSMCSLIYCFAFIELYKKWVEFFPPHRIESLLTLF